MRGRTLKYIFSIFIAFQAVIMMPFAVHARYVFSPDSIKVRDTLQINSPDEEPIKNDTLAARSFFSGVEIMADYGKLLLLWAKFESKYAGGITLRFFERVALVTEGGYSTLNPLKAYEDALYYNVKGSYGRLGVNYLTSYDPNNFYYIGLMYGMSFFSDEGEIFLEDTGEYPQQFGSQDITASWIEIVLGTETFLKSKRKTPDEKKANFLLGWTFRVRILTDFQNREDFPIYSIPGYGRTFNNATAALNFYIKYRIGK